MTYRLEKDESEIVSQPNPIAINSTDTTGFKVSSWKKIISSLATIVVLFGAFFHYYGFTLKCDKIRLQNFESIVDTDDVITHLQKLHLTPNHSVKILSTNSDGTITKEKLLHGRFLHLTDMHPDELNVIGGAIRTKCHKKVASITDEEDISHKFGDSLSGCDSPIDLYTSTLQWIRENLKDHIDFVIWTGDNIRHDNDRNHPRTEYDIFDMNEKVADDILKTFMDDGEENMDPHHRRIKVVPSLGNNDVYPHNLFAPGPTLQTREMYKIWRHFIPNDQMHTFDRGAYFFSEVIPGKMVVLSINTLYWFSSNPLNDNCDNRKQPGFQLFLWLGATLKECRRRGLKVWLSGHVPPIPKNIHHSCYAKISVWMHEYRDIIIGGVWGHMNIDHWVPLDSVAAWKSIEKRLLNLGVLKEGENLPYIDYENQSLAFDALHEDDPEEIMSSFETVQDLYKAFGINTDDESDTPFSTFSDRFLGAPKNKVGYLEDIRDSMYATLKWRSKGGKNLERYAIAHISSSVIPTYNPGMRVWEYNITEFISGKQIEPQTTNILGRFYHRLRGFLTKSHESQYVHLQECDWSDFFQKLEQELDDEATLTRLIEKMESDLNAFSEQEYLDIMSPKKDKTIPNIMPEDTPLGPAYIPQTFSPQRYIQYYIDLNDVNYGKTKINDWKFQYNFHYATDETEGMDSLLVSDWVKRGRKYAKAVKTDELDENDFTISRFKRLWNKYIDRAFMSSGYQFLDLDN